MVVVVAALSREAAPELLARANGSVKLALVMHTLGVGADEAARRLEAAGGVIRRVVPGAPPPVK
jgi:N-acetylmuramic acid 6-phosphate etherase